MGREMVSSMARSAMTMPAAVNPMLTSPADSGASPRPSTTGTAASRATVTPRTLPRRLAMSGANSAPMATNNDAVANVVPISASSACRCSWKKTFMNGSAAA